MIILKGITKLYHQFPAVRDLDLEVHDGEIMGLIGHNGAGKSTTLKMIAGLLRPTRGEIQIMGRNMARESTVVKSFLGYLAEESSLYENMTAAEYLTFFSELYRIPRARAQERIASLLDALKLSERSKLTGELSKGMKRKVAIARTLLHDPMVLILDEPNSGLDPLTSFFIIEYLQNLKRQGKTILLSAHNLFHVEYICDRVAILKEGRLLVCDTMKAIRSAFGHREYEVVFRCDEALDYERQEGNYHLRATDVGAVAAMLREISERNWALVDLSAHDSALEDIYVQLMTHDTLPAQNAV